MCFQPRSSHIFFCNWILGAVQSCFPPPLRPGQDDEKAAEAAVNKLILTLGNIVHDSVPVSDNEDNNAVVRTWGTPLQAEKLPNHVDLIAMLDIVDTEKGTEVAGGRGYYLKGAGVLLNQAIINFALGFLVKRGYTPMHTPFFIKKARAGLRSGPAECSAAGFAPACGSPP